jgi:hypothetical protein
VCQCERHYSIGTCIERQAPVKAEQCKDCIEELRSKHCLLRALTLDCVCYKEYEWKLFKSDRSGVKRKILRHYQQKRATECEKCIEHVKRLLLIGSYPACMCKDKNSKDLFTCRPFCKYRVNDVYNKDRTFFLDIEFRLRLWQKPEQLVLPTCECWVPYARAECIPECAVRISDSCYELYQESCPCNPQAIHKISDEYCWVYRCEKCKPRVYKTALRGAHDGCSRSNSLPNLKSARVAASPESNIAGSGRSSSSSSTSSNSSGSAYFDIRNRREDRTWE